MPTFDNSLITNPAWRRVIARARLADRMATEVAAEPRRPKGQRMNALESAYAERLEAMRAAGLIRSWEFNAIRLRIADGEKTAFYRPDFLVHMADGSAECHETKGYERPAALLRLKIAAGKYRMFRFLLVKRLKGQWTVEPFRALDDGSSASVAGAGGPDARRRCDE